MHNGLLDACLYAPLPCVNATWHWQEGPSKTMMWAAADPASAGESQAVGLPVDLVEFF